MKNNINQNTIVMKYNILFLCIFASLLFLSCGGEDAKPGSKDNPIKFFFTPSVDSENIASNSKELIQFLENETGLVFKTGIPTNYITVVEAFGSGRADIAIMNPFGYLLSNFRYKTVVKLRTIRFGETSYRGQIITRTDSGIDSIEQLNGKKFAYADPSSTSGYLFPAKLLKERNIIPGSTVFAMKHDIVVAKVYEKQVDAGATYYSPPSPTGEPRDARTRVKTQFPDVMEKIKIIALTEEIPNDPVVFSNELPKEIVDKIIAAILKFSQTEDGKKTFMNLYNIEGFVETQDQDYDVLRKILVTNEIVLETLVK
ncbi:MAG: phosphate/phosphite/phosphonate ABC transporter substrate-binding protein [Bacteroidales bacterium]